MTVSKIADPSSASIRLLVIGVLTLYFLLGIAGAVQRFSPGHGILIDSLDIGGGGSSSSSYQQVDSAIGQESVCGLATGAGFQNNTGIIQPWVRDHTAAESWDQYH